MSGSATGVDPAGRDAGSAPVASIDGEFPAFAVGLPGWSALPGGGAAAVPARLAGVALRAAGLLAPAAFVPAGSAVLDLAGFGSVKGASARPGLARADVAAGFALAALVAGDSAGAVVRAADSAGVSPIGFGSGSAVFRGAAAFLPVDRWEAARFCGRAGRWRVPCGCGAACDSGESGDGWAGAGGFEAGAGSGGGAVGRRARAFREDRSTAGGVGAPVAGVRAAAAFAGGCAVQSNGSWAGRPRVVAGPSG